MPPHTEGPLRSLRLSKPQPRALTLSFSLSRISPHHITVATRLPARLPSRSATSLLVAQATSLQFVKGVKETSVPDVKLTRARDGASGVATFVFDEPSIFEASSELGDITGLYMEDDEGVISTVDVQVTEERRTGRERDERAAQGTSQRLAFFLAATTPLSLIISLLHRPSSSTASPTASRPGTP